MDAAGHKASEIEEGIESDGAPSRLYDRYRAIRDDPTREARWAKWQEENAAAIEAYNRWFEKNGHPLADYMIKPGEIPR